jgi:hypothetical protein
MRRHLLPLAILLFGLAGCLEAQLTVPKVGVVRFPDGGLRTVLGLDSNFIVNREVIAKADADSFSDQGGLLAKNGRIQLLGPDLKVVAEYDSGESAPLLNIDGDLRTAIAWLPTERALLYWDGKSFALAQTNDQLLSHVLALRVGNSKTAKLLILEQGGAVSSATVSLESGNLLALNFLPGVQRSVFEQHSFLLFQDRDGLEIQAPDGKVRTIPISVPDLSFERISSDWLHLTSPSAKQDWLLHLNRSTLAISQLPAAPMEVSK